MKIKKAPVFGETEGLIKTIEQIDFKSFSLPGQEKQPVLKFGEPINRRPKSSRIVECFECHLTAELDGYRFRLVPVCACCRTVREIEVTGNRFERRNKK